MTLKLLLVGKEKSAFQLIKDVFDNEDVDIIVATSIGLALYLTRKNQPNLIISQQELADSDAMNFFYELKSEKELADIPFVLISTSKGSQQINRETNKNNSSAANISNEYAQLLQLDESSMSNTIDLKNKILALLTGPCK